MFEAIDEVVLFASDAKRSLWLYAHHFGFTPSSPVAMADPQLLRLWGCDGPVSVTSLVKPGSTGGSIRLVDVRGKFGDRRPRQMHMPGPFAIDFYVRGMLDLHQRLRDDGFTFRSEPQRYRLFGTSFDVEEVLLDSPEGFVHALVEYLPSQHRCVLGERPYERVSEVVAQVTVTDNLEAGLQLLRDALGGQVYFNEEFSGPVVERLIDLPPGSVFRAVIMRGPNRRNARMELMTQVGTPDQSDDPPPQPPRMFPSITVASMSDALDRAAQCAAAVQVEGPIDMPEALGGGRVATLSTPFGVFVQLRETTRLSGR